MEAGEHMVSLGVSLQALD